VVITAEALVQIEMIHELHTVSDGEAALDYLRRQGDYTEALRPDLVLLDLNLPRLDPKRRAIPIGVFSTSVAEEDIAGSYDLHANAYVSKPVDFDAFIKAVRGIDEFFGTIVRLPPTEP
jgi:CheY-like chemotaxis protein